MTFHNYTYVEVNTNLGEEVRYDADRAHHQAQNK
jgi:hypothetical protein